MADTPYPEKVHLIINPAASGGKPDVIHDPLPAIDADVLAALTGLVKLRVALLGQKKQGVMDELAEKNARIIPGKLRVAFNIHDGPEAKALAEEKAMRLARAPLQQLETDRDWYQQLIDVFEKGLADIEARRLPSPEFITSLESHAQALVNQLERAELEKETNPIAVIQISTQLAAVRKFLVMIYARRHRIPNT